MKKFNPLVSITLVSAWMLLALVPIFENNAMAIEEPSFKLIKKWNDFEVREYDANLTARVELTSDFEKAGNAGFRILADYIFGKNRSKTKIDMTAPVALSEKIEMTAPVSMTGDQSHYQVEFTMPRAYTKANLPEPLDPQIKIIENPPILRAVRRYAGSWSQEDYLKQKAQLLTLIQQNGYEPTGEAIFSRFDPPFIPWFLRHNEVWINIKLVSKSPDSTGGTR